MLKEPECLGCLKWNSLGRMFSGLLDQSDTQSMLFFRASTSSSPSAASSDWELWSLLVCISTSNITCPSSCGEGLCSEDCLWNCSVWIHAVHPKESFPCPHCDEEDTCSSPPFFPLPLSLPLLLFTGSSTQELLRLAGSGRDCSPFSQLLCRGSGCSTKWNNIVRQLEELQPWRKELLQFSGSNTTKEFVFLRARQ